MGRKRSNELSARQRMILEVLAYYQSTVGYPPSIRQICQETGISSTSVVNYYLNQLETMGYIERDQHTSRGIRLVKPLESAVGTVVKTAVAAARQTVQKATRVVEEMLHVPMVGRIFASNPVPLPPSDFNYFDETTRMVGIARSMLPARERGDGLFALEVQGDSMIDAMINDGDIVIMKPATEARNGDLVAIWLKDKDETTLKYFYRENGRVRLQPANPTMKPIYIDDPSIVEVQGKVVMVIRQVATVM